jgi:hypothetical protein
MNYEMSSKVNLGVKAEEGMELDPEVEETGFVVMLLLALHYLESWCVLDSEWLLLLASSRAGAVPFY